MIDIFEQCTSYLVDLTELDNNLRETIMDDLNCVDTIVRIYGTEIEEYDIDSSAIDYSSAEFDESILLDTLECHINDFPHYLVFASGCRWNGTSGYKFCTKLLDTVYRDYDVSIWIKKSIDSKVMICKESSHDVPTGSNTYIIGLTSKEYNKLKDAEFEDIEEFISQYKE